MTHYNNDQKPATKKMPSLSESICKIPRHPDIFGLTDFSGLPSHNVAVLAEASCNWQNSPFLGALQDLERRLE